MRTADKRLNRREWLAAAAAALGGAARGLAAEAPVSPVSIGKYAGYDDHLVEGLAWQFNQLGGIGRLVSGKTVAIKLNLTGGGRLGNYTAGQTHRVHPDVVGACCHLFGRAGARRIRLLEGAGRGEPLEDKMLNGGWDVAALRNSAPVVEFENTNYLGSGKRYARLKAPRGFIYPGFDLNHSYEDADVFVSLSKIKHHEECGITLTIKNMFGATPNSIYGDDAGVDEPNENARRGREAVLHLGKRPPSRSAPQEIDPAGNRYEGYRVPRISVDLVAARPLDLCILDGIESSVGGEGPWVKGFQYAKPQMLVVGWNPVCTDTVAAALMGYNPRAERGQTPFHRLTPVPEGQPAWAENPMLLAESIGLGSADLSRIEVRGVPIQEAMFDFESRRKI
jgi:uncharacterized protein (DUF362 family)